MNEQNQPQQKIDNENTDNIEHNYSGESNHDTLNSTLGSSVLQDFEKQINHYNQLSSKNASDIKGDGNKVYQINTFFSNTEQPQEKVFSEKQLRRLKKTEADINDLDEKLSCFDSKLTEKISSQLKKNGILLLSGNSDDLVKKIAKYIAVDKENHFQSNNELNVTGYITGALEQNMKFDFSTFIGVEEWKNSILVFNDVLQKGNSQFIDLISNLEKIENYIDGRADIHDLKSQNTYIILVLSDEDLSNYPNLEQKNNNILLQLSISKEEKVKYIERNTSKYQEKLPKEIIEQIINELNDIKKIDEFLEILEDKKDDNLPIEDIERLIDSVLNYKSHIKEVTKDFLTFTHLFSACLVLSHGNKKNKVSALYTEFEFIRRELYIYLKKHLKLKENEMRDWATLIEQDAFFKKCKIQIDSDSSSQIQIFFENDSYLDTAWQYFKYNQPNILISILGFLEEAAINSSYKASVICSLGRYGEIDRGFIFRKITEYTHNNDTSLANLVHGIYATQNSSYIAESIQYIKQLVMDKGGKEEVLFLWIFLLGRIGIHDVKYSIGELTEILMNDIAPKLESFLSEISNFSWAQSKVNTHSNTLLNSSIVSEEMLFKWVESKKNEKDKSGKLQESQIEYIKKVSINSFIQSQIIHLSYNVEINQVLKELLSWVEDKSKGTEILYAFTIAGFDNSLLSVFQIKYLIDNLLSQNLKISYPLIVFRLAENENLTRTLVNTLKKVVDIYSTSSTVKKILERNIISFYKKLILNTIPIRLPKEHHTIKDKVFDLILNFMVLSIIEIEKLKHRLIELIIQFEQNQNNDLKIIHFAREVNKKVKN